MGLAGFLDTRRQQLATLLAGVVAAAHFASFDVGRQPVVTDIRYYLYFAAETFRGAVPHQDFFDNKTQLATFVGAALYGLGQAVGIDPLLAIRVGYLVLAGVAGILLFAIHRRLAGDRATAGLLALLAYCGFALLGVMPSIGNIPKLLTAFFASLAALLASDRRWVLAGVAGALATMDWQLGLLVLAAVFGAALLERGKRLRSGAYVALGAVLGAAPFGLYYAAHGALGAALAQTVGASLFRGMSSASALGLGDRLAHLLAVIVRGCAGHSWLVAVGGVGMLVYPLWIRRHLRRTTRPLVVALGIYHYGLVTFSLVDFQLYGDLFILLHSVAFFSAVAFVELGELAAGRIARLRVATRHRRLVIARVTVVLLTLAATRPSVLRPPFVLATANAAPHATLEDQREVSRRALPLLEDRRLAFTQFSELLFLTGQRNAVPFVFWNAATHYYYRSSPDESSSATSYRMIAAVRPDVVTAAVLDPRLARDFRAERISSDNYAYSVVLFVRRPQSPASRPSQSAKRARYAHAPSAERSRRPIVE